MSSNPVFILSLSKFIIIVISLKSTRSIYGVHIISNGVCNMLCTVSILMYDILKDILTNINEKL